MRRPINRLKILVGTAALLGGGLAGGFGAVLWQSSVGEVAGALGSLVGGMVGAAGAVWAVFLMLSRQRQEDAAEVADAVRTEVAALVKYVIGAIHVCQQIKGGLRIPRQDARYVVKNLWGDPVVYEAVADRIGLLPHPHATVEFYMRLQEARSMVEMLRIRTNPDSATYVTPPIEFVAPEFAGSLVESLATALQLARPIVADEGNASGKSQLALQVEATVVAQIDECLKSAQISFPDAESFHAPSPVGSIS